MRHGAFVFGYDWFSRLVPDIREHCGDLIGRSNLRILEIGSFEGRSSVWFLLEMCNTPDSVLVCVDPWVASIEYSDEEMQTAERRFDQNTALARRNSLGSMKKLKLRSEDALPRLPAASFDLVFLDGSHLAFDVLRDLVWSWRALKPGGRVVCDDYRLEDTCQGIGMPRLAIDAFLSCCGECEVLQKGYSVIIKKLPLGDCRALASLELEATIAMHTDVG